MFCTVNVSKFIGLLIEKWKKFDVLNTLKIVGKVSFETKLAVFTSERK